MSGGCVRIGQRGLIGSRLRLSARVGLRRLRGRRRAPGLRSRLSFSPSTAFQLLEAELVVVRHLLQLRLHLADRELQPLDLAGQGTNLVLQLLDLHIELRFRAALRLHEDGGEDGRGEDCRKGDAAPQLPPRKG